MQLLSEVLIYIYLVGNFFFIFGGVLGISVVLHHYRDTITNNSQTRLYDNYGLFWGCVVLSVFGNVLLTVHAGYIICIYSSHKDLIPLAWAIAIQVLIATVVSLVAAVSLSSWEWNLSIPAIFMCFERAKEIREKIVLCLSLWSLILFLLHILGRMPFVILALLALPPTVIFTLLIYIMAAVCMVQFLAISFTFVEMKRRPHPRRCSCLYDLIQLSVFACLFLAVLCFSTLISAIGALANYGPFWSSLYSVFSIFATSTAPLGLVWVLRQIGCLWLQAHRIDASMPPQADHEDQPSQANHEDHPSQANHDDQPPQANHEDQPSQGNHEDQPPRANSEDQPPQANREDQPPQANREDQTPQADREDQPPQADHEDQCREDRNDSQRLQVTAGMGEENDGAPTSQPPVVATLVNDGAPIPNIAVDILAISEANEDTPLLQYTTKPQDVCC